jgi:hypothetical protein
MKHNEDTRRALIVGATGAIASVMLPIEDATAGLLVGDVIKVVGMLNLLPYAMVAAGTYLTVLAVDFITGVCECAFTEPVDGMEEWKQRLVLVPFQTEDILPNLQHEVAWNSVAMEPKLCLAS